MENLAGRNIVMGFDISGLSLLGTEVLNLRNDSLFFGAEESRRAEAGKMGSLSERRKL